jgi:SAM-dependent methyltransferase
MLNLINFLDRKFYPNFQNHWDDLALRNKILSNLNPEFRVLDYGAGSGFVKEMNFKDLGAKIAGIDMDSSVLTNPFLDEAFITNGSVLPFEEDSFDLVISDNVLEHLENPRTVFSEISRVLKSNGKLIIKTPNKWHYMSLIASYTPHWFHVFYNSLRGRTESDTFPTQYKVNTPKDIEACANHSGLKIEEIQLIEGRPEYLRIFFILYLFGLFYERIVNRFNTLAKFRVVIIAVMVKSDAKALNSVTDNRIVSAKVVVENAAS